MNARDLLRRAAAGCSVPNFSRRITALRHSIGTVLNDLLRGMTVREEPAGGRANELTDAE
jgi:hypothetical protein